MPRFRRAAGEIQTILGSILLCLAMPAISSAGVLRWTSTGPLSGPVGALKIDPSDRFAVYAGVRDLANQRSFLFRSSDNGETWILVAEATDRAEISAIEIDAALPTRLFGATLRGFYRSEDHGLTWVAGRLEGSTIRQLLLAQGVGAPLLATGVNCRCIRIPCLTGLVCEGQLLRSDDSGDSWQETSAIQARVLAADPTDSRVLYVAGQGVVFRSSDGGRGWFRLAGLGLERCTSITSLAVHPGDPRVLFAGAGRDSQFPCGGVLRSDDAGATWRSTSISPRHVTSVVLDPMQPDTVYAASASLNSIDPRPGVARSLDGGATWSEFSEGIQGRNVYHLVIDPTGTFLHAGTDAGVFSYELRLVRPPRDRALRVPIAMPPRSQDP